MSILKRAIISVLSVGGLVFTFNDGTNFTFNDGEDFTFTE